MTSPWLVGSRQRGLHAPCPALCSREAEASAEREDSKAFLRMFVTQRQ